MEPGNIRTREILFPEGEIRTDSMLYREKCRLLLPEPYTQNMFYVQGDQYQTRFFLASDSTRNLERMESFFSRIYGSVFEDSPLPEDGAGHSLVLRNSALNLRKKEFYHPGFVRNILDFTSIDRAATMRYCVTIRSGKGLRGNPGRYNFTITVGFNSEQAERKFSDLLAYELKTMRRQSGFSLKRAGKARMRDNLLSIPFNLINFIRIPSERDIMV